MRLKHANRIWLVPTLVDFWVMIYKDTVVARMKLYDVSILTPGLKGQGKDQKKGKLARGERDREMKIRQDKMRMRAFCDFLQLYPFPRSGSMLANLHSMLEEALTLSDSKVVMENLCSGPQELNREKVEWLKLTIEWRHGLHHKTVFIVWIS